MVKTIKIERPETHGNQWCICRLNGFNLADEFDGAEIGEQILITYGEMEEEELNALPDFAGW